MTNWNPPQWLTDALAAHPAPPVRKTPAADIMPGDIRICTGADGVTCFVLVLTGVNRTHSYLNLADHSTVEVPSYEWVTVAILTNDWEAGADYNPRLDPDHTGLPFKLLVTDLMPHVFPTQIGGDCYGDGLCDEDLAEVMAAIWHSEPPTTMWRGLPLTGRTDPRWAEQTAWYYDYYQPLSAPANGAFFADLDGEPHPAGCGCSLCQPDDEKPE